MKTINELRLDLEAGKMDLQALEEKAAALQAEAREKIKADLAGVKSYTASARGKDQEDLAAVSAKIRELETRLPLIAEAIQEAILAENGSDLNQVDQALREIRADGKKLLTQLDADLARYLATDSAIHDLATSWRKLYARRVALIRAENPGLSYVGEPAPPEDLRFPLKPFDLNGIQDGNRPSGERDPRYLKRRPGWVAA